MQKNYCKTLDQLEGWPEQVKTMQTQLDWSLRRRRHQVCYRAGSDESY